MAVHLTRIYTRTGDEGSTGLSNFDRVAKDDSRLVAYADCDETGAAIGLALACGEPSAAMREVLSSVQNDLFDAGADLSTPVEENPKYAPLRITPGYIKRLEGLIDELNAPLPALTSFILAGGTPLAAHLHVARTVCRRAERSAWTAVREHPENTSALPAKYLNRLSDLLFVLCRTANGGDDVLWRPGGERAERGAATDPDTDRASTPDQDSGE
ncbi:cob(I)yrinic acid a,c-diamide adenosyltransferase [Dietzia sp.]|uniref:cob(I)yrinic acid a,c-diamide adenosyltransferase n=1 Tax=Dietzia sp. TaxID=1871616 RepID=UPI002FD91ECE